MSLLTSLLILIVAARLMGKLFARYNQPEMIGEILAGVILGPGLLGVIKPGPALAGISDLAVFLVIMTAGLEMRFGDIFSAMKGRGLLLAAAGFVIPFAGGGLIGLIFGLDLMRTIFLGLCISITALPVAARIMESLNILESRIARYAIATAILNDVAALMILGIILGVPAEPSLEAVFKTFGQSVIKLSLLVGFMLFLNWMLEYLDRQGFGIQFLPESLVRVFGPEALFGIVALFVLLFGSVSEALGFHFVIGAFFGALLLDKRHFLASRYDELHKTLASITNGFLAPVFFAYLGLEFNILEMDSVLLAAAVLAVSVGTKVLAGWWGGRIVGMAPREALGLGCILNGRGVMELVVASIAYQKGFINAGMFSTLVLMGIVTTLLTPILFNRVLPSASLESYRRTGQV